MDTSASAPADQDPNRGGVSGTPGPHGPPVGGVVRRPMNAFLIFCKRHRTLVRLKNKHLDNRSVTRILGELWASLPAEDKVTYKDLAKQYKEAFMKANPDYRWYNPEKSVNTATATAPTKSPPQPLSGDSLTPGKLADPSNVGGLSLLLMDGTSIDGTDRSPSTMQQQVKASSLQQLAEMCTTALEVPDTSHDSFTHHSQKQKKKQRKTTMTHNNTSAKQQSAFKGWTSVRSKDKGVDMPPSSSELKFRPNQPSNQFTCASKSSSVFKTKAALKSLSASFGQGHPECFTEIRAQPGSKKLVPGDVSVDPLAAAGQTNTQTSSTSINAPQPQITMGNFMESMFCHEGKKDLPECPAPAPAAPAVLPPSMTFGQIQEQVIRKAMDSSSSSTGKLQDSPGKTLIQGMLLSKGEDIEKKLMSSEEKIQAALTSHLPVATARDKTLPPAKKRRKNAKKANNYSAVMDNLTAVIDMVARQGGGSGGGGVEDGDELESGRKVLSQQQQQQVPRLKMKATTNDSEPQRRLSVSEGIGEGEDSGKGLRKSRRINRGKRYEQLVSQGIIQSSRHLQSTESKSEEAANKDFKPCPAALPAHKGLTRKRKRTVSETSVSGEGGVKYKTGDFDLDEKIARLRPCVIKCSTSLPSATASSAAVPSHHHSNAAAAATASKKHKKHKKHKKQPRRRNSSVTLPPPKHHHQKRRKGCGRDKSVTTCAVKKKLKAIPHLPKTHNLTIAELLLLIKADGPLNTPLTTTIGPLPAPASVAVAVTGSARRKMRKHAITRLMPMPGSATVKENDVNCNSATSTSLATSSSSLATP